MNYRYGHQQCVPPIVWWIKKSVWLIILLSIISTCFIWQHSSAQSDTANDCAIDYSLVRSDEIIGITNNTIFPQRLLDIAIENHTAYCCDHYRNRMKDMSICTQSRIQDKMENNSYAESPVFSDHLTDLGFRYIDGDEDKQYADRDGSPIIDTQGKAWKEMSMNIASAPFGYMPGAIWQAFGQAWGMDSDGFVSEVYLATTCEDNKIQYADFSSNREKKPLSEKYFMICHVAQCLNPYKQATINTSLDTCMKLAGDRITAEMDRVQSVMIVQWNAAILSSFQAYAQWFLIQDQMNMILEKYSDMDAWFTFLNNKVPEVVPMCS